MTDRNNGLKAMLSLSAKYYRRSAINRALDGLSSRVVHTISTTAAFHHGIRLFHDELSITMTYH